MTKQQQQPPQIMQPGHYDEDQDEGRLVEKPDIQALTQLNSAEISQQIMTARAYPRSVTNFRRSMREMVTYDQPTALSCLYALKRSGKVIEGASIRFAEAALQSWGNARAGSRIVDVGSEFITAQGFFYDLEKNMALAFEVMRRITDREGNRYGDDMIGVTGNAACSIAIRNAILRGIPKTAWNEPYQAARQVSIGKGESITVKRQEMLKAFAPLGVDKEQIFGLLGVKGIDDVTVEQMMFMAGILNSIKEGEQKAEEVFAPENMVNAAQVAPPRPKASAFTRDETKTPGQKDAAPAKPATETEKPKPAAQPEPEQKRMQAAEAAEVDKGDESEGVEEAAGSDELIAWLDDNLKEVESIPMKTEAEVKVARGLYEGVLEQLDAGMVPVWNAAWEEKLDTVEVIRAVTAIRDMVLDNLPEADQQGWIAKCDARGKVILRAITAGKGKK